MLAYTFYESDTRVRRYAESLAKRGDKVDVIALRRNSQLKYELINGVNVYRIQKRENNEKWKVSYLFRLLKFFLLSALFVGKKSVSSPYNIVHVHSVPDFEVFAAIIPKLMGARIILDIHDIVPEFYVSKFKVSDKSVVFKLLLLIEKISSAFSDHVIIANHIWEKTITSRSVGKEKCTTLINYPDLSIFKKSTNEKSDDKFIIMYPGTLNWHQGLDIAIRAFPLIKDKAPNAELHIYGEGPSKELLINLIDELNLGDRVFLKEILPLEKISKIMSNAHLGIVPKRASSFGNEAFSTKILEFMALGVPVLIANTKIDRHYFNDSIVKFFKAEDEKDLAEAMLLLIKDKELRKRLVMNANKFIMENNWAVKEAEYYKLVDNLTGYSYATS